MYAPKYTESGFRGVRTGMSTGEVRKLLGPPLAIEKQEFHDEWIYRAGQSNAGIDLGAFSTGEHQVPAARHILFDSSGRVTSAHGNHLRPVSTGSTKEQVQLAFGWPSQTNFGHAGEVYVYTKAKKGGDYKQRRIIFNTSGLVVEVVSLTYYD